MIYFYKDLKDNIKNDFYRKDILGILIEYMQYIVRIDNHLYIHYIEKCS